MTTLNDLKEKEFSVLDDGFIILKDVMGSDAAVTQAARVCYGEGTKPVSDDRTLIRYLMRHQHRSPFEMAELKFHLRLPIDVGRQWARHRTASINEYSTRYSVAIHSLHKTDPCDWRKQTQENRQGSCGVIDLDLGQRLTEEENDFHDAAMTLYQKRIELGIAREQARKDLPLCLYTEAYWKIDLRNLLHFLGLRMEAHAQREIREYATIIGEKVVKPLFPLTWEAFEDFHLYAMTLSRPEQQLIRELTARPSLPVSKEAAIESLPEEWRLLPRCRERDEALSKLDCLGLVEENDRNTGV